MKESISASHAAFDEDKRLIEMIEMIETVRLTRDTIANSVLSCERSRKCKEEKKYLEKRGNLRYESE